jgi:hypothetical protein
VENPFAISSGVPVIFEATAENGTAPYDIIWSLPGSDQTEVQDSIASSGGSSSVSVSYLADGTYTATFSATDSKGQSCSDTRSVEVGSAPPPPPPTAANFSILPPFNVVHAQVIERGTGDTPETLPKILTNADVDVVYSATSSDLDPAGAGSINTTSDSSKTNFWDLSGTTQIASHPNTIGGLAYAPLYPSVLAGALLDPPTNLSSFCNSTEYPDGCPSILNLFEPLAYDAGLPVPDLHALFPAEGSGLEAKLVVAQQHMPGPGNAPQLFDRFDVDLPFFVNFPFGYTVFNANWFAADGIPILPIDDDGNENAYPLMRVQAISKDCDSPINEHCDATDPDNVLASVDIVLPVASEADCQSCHAASDDPALALLGQVSNGAAADMSDTSFAIQYTVSAPGTGTLNQLQNAAKINILRLHDAKHGAQYEAWDTNGQLAGAACNATDPSDPNCLANQTPVQCSQCHYSPALDLAQAGPVDEPEQGPRGRQQRHHISQSRAMHGHHGEFTDLFPEMPPPNDSLRTAGATPINAFEQGILEETCYACHPGKNTQCLRGAMFNAGMVCQDCHGNMAEVGNDFTEDFPTHPFVGDGTGGEDLSKRVSWANEPGCQSCHTGDAVNNLAGDFPTLVADDGIRLLQAYVKENHPDDDSQVAAIIEAPDSRFAENQSLYRLSQGHGGVKCENCHGSTHAIWPVTPRDGPFVANDNLAAIQLQGHDGKIQECDVCHERGADGNLSMPLSLDGPHGMHPVGDNRWNHQHRNFTGGKNANCKGCHGPDLTGTVLSATSADRVLDCKNNQGDFPDCAAGNATAFVEAGTQIGCGNCHKQK